MSAMDKHGDDEFVLFVQVYVLFEYPFSISDLGFRV